MADTQPRPNDAVPSKERLGTRCCHCLCQTFWILLVLIITIVMLAILVLYIIITPRSFRFTLIDANLTQFDYTANNSTLYYDLVLNITAHNPNKRLKIYYDVVRAHALYRRVEFSAADVNMPWNGYLQDKKGTNFFGAVFSGQRVMGLNRDQIAEDKKDGMFPIDLKIHFTMRFRLDDFQLGHYYPRGTCELKVPLTSNNGNKRKPQWGTFDAASDVKEAVKALGDEGVDVDRELALGGEEHDVSGEQSRERDEKEAKEGGELGEQGGDGEAF
ncbi:hypothetical protein JHK86_027393 [Glycine max]|nr:hypothetical protein JHK86_027393 [Glycine max]